MREELESLAPKVELWTATAAFADERRRRARRRTNVRLGGGAVAITLLVGIGVVVFGEGDPSTSVGDPAAADDDDTRPATDSSPTTVPPSSESVPRSCGTGGRSDAFSDAQRLLATPDRRLDSLYSGPDPCRLEGVRVIGERADGTTMVVPPALREGSTPADLPADLEKPDVVTVTVWNRPWPCPPVVDELRNDVVSFDVWIGDLVRSWTPPEPVESCGIAYELSLDNFWFGDAGGTPPSAETP